MHKYNSNVFWSQWRALCTNIIQMCSGITCGRVLNEELYAQSLH